MSKDPARGTNPVLSRRASLAAWACDNHEKIAASILATFRAMM